MPAPQDVIAEFMRAKFGRPSRDVEEVIEAFAALADGSGAASPQPVAVPDDVAARIEAIEARLAKLEAAPAPADPSADLHKRLAALEAARPARAAAPAAKPAA